MLLPLMSRPYPPDLSNYMGCFRLPLPRPFEIAMDSRLP
jgi:hypothetical protein